MSRSFEVQFLEFLNTMSKVGLSNGPEFPNFEFPFSPSICIQQPSYGSRGEGGAEGRGGGGVWGWEEGGGGGVIFSQSFVFNKVWNCQFNICSWIPISCSTLNQLDIFSLSLSRSSLFLALSLSLSLSTLSLSYHSLFSTILTKYLNFLFFQVCFHKGQKNWLLTVCMPSSLSCFNFAEFIHWLGNSIPSPGAYICI